MMNKQINPAEILARPYARKLTPDPDGGFTVTVHEFPGCIAHGDTANEAFQNFEKAAESWIEAAADSNYPVHEPANYEECSGKIALRISRRLHQMAAERADREGVSLNQLLATAISAYLGQQNSLEAALETIKRELRGSLSNLTSINVQVFPLMNPVSEHAQGFALAKDAFDKIRTLSNALPAPEGSKFTAISAGGQPIRIPTPFHKL